MRTNRHQYFLDLASRCARQGTCLRRNFGAIIVDEFNTIVSTGYTGAPRKQMDCTELNRCWRKEHNIPSGSNYERCRSVHAEMNALLQAGTPGAARSISPGSMSRRTGSPRSGPVSSAPR